MGLYLCVFRDEKTDDELEGVEVGSYDDFQTLRSAVAERLEGSRWGSRFPTLMGHPDSDGIWTPQEAKALEGELLAIQREFSDAPAKGFAGGWQAEVAKSLGLRPSSLAECFIDVDGDPLLDRLIGLCRIAQTAGTAIWFQ